MDWDVKIYLAKIKDGKGKDFMFLAKKTLLTIIRPKQRLEPVFIPYAAHAKGLKLGHEMERNTVRLSEFQPP
jgi:hypothetical protein